MRITRLGGRRTFWPYTFLAQPFWPYGGKAITVGPERSNFVNRSGPANICENILKITFTNLIDMRSIQKTWSIAIPVTRFGARETSVANLIKQQMGIFIVEDTDGSVTSNFMDSVSSLYSIDTQSRSTVILDDNGISALTTGTRFVSSFRQTPLVFRRLGGLALLDINYFTVFTE